MSETLDIIKYISFKKRGSKVLTMIPLPVALEEIRPQQSYSFDISKMSYYDDLKCFLMDTRATGMNKFCTVKTVFGETHTQSQLFVKHKLEIIVVTTTEKMSYKNNYYHNISSGRRFEVMDL
jgi:hypothetical protein